MSAWRPARSLMVLNTELNATFPTRDHASDGTIGDTSHAARKSDHNPDPRLRPLPPPVRARDYDSSLQRGLTVDDKVGRPLLACLIWNGQHGHPACGQGSYAIFQGRIYSATWGWAARAYDGLSGHFEHVHWSSSYAGYDSTQRFDLARFVAAAAPRQPLILPAGGSGLRSGQVYGPDSGRRESWIDGRESDGDLRAVRAVAAAVADPRARTLTRYDRPLQQRVKVVQRALAASGTKGLRVDGATDDATWRALARRVQRRNRAA